MELTLTRDSVHADDPLPWRPPRGAGSSDPGAPCSRHLPGEGRAARGRDHPPADSPVAGYWWADLAHGYHGDAQEVAKRWVTRPRTW